MAGDAHLFRSEYQAELEQWFKRRFGFLCLAYWIWGFSRLFIHCVQLALHLFGQGRAETDWGGLYRDGLELTAVNPALGAYFGTEQGVLVTDVDRSSGLGLQTGDVVVRIGDRAVTSPDRFRRILASYGDEEDINFHIMRDGSETVVTGRLRY